MPTALSTPLPALRWAANAPCRDRAGGSNALVCDVAALCCCGRQPKNGGLAVCDVTVAPIFMRQMGRWTNRNNCCSARLSMEASLSQASNIVPKPVELDEDVEDMMAAPFFSGSSLDTAAHLRDNTEALQALLRSPSSKLIPWYEEQVLVQDAQQQSPNSARPQPKDLSPKGHLPSLVPVLLSPAFQHLPSVDPAVGAVFMGLEQGSGDAVFAGILKPGKGQDVEEGVGGRWAKLRSVGPQLSAGDAGLLAMAHGLLVWHMGDLHCGKTGRPTEPTLGGHARITKPAEANQEERRPIIQYPRIDPAVITLVTSGDYCLLGRKHSWGRNRYSLLAGFLEVGETLENAVMREVLEEASVKVAPQSVKYVASQPWPFPRSLMVAFRAAIAHPADPTYLVQGTPYHFSGHLVAGCVGFERLKGAARSAAIDSGILSGELDEYLGAWLPRPQAQQDELEHVAWFHRDFLAKVALPNATPGDVSVPGGYAIARKVLQAWAVEGSRDPWSGDSVADVRIDTGRFKYVLMRVSDGIKSKIVVRGSTAATYHMNLVEATKAEYRHLGLEFEPVGGGRIEHDPVTRRISIYGYSSAFGQAVHDVTAALCARWMPLYETTGISVSYDGY